MIMVAQMINLVSGLVKVEDPKGAVPIKEEFPLLTSTDHTDSFCYGSRAIYSNDSIQYNFNITNEDKNRIKAFENDNSKFIIVEWNIDDTLTLVKSSDDNTSGCAGNEIPIMIITNEDAENQVAPTGTIERFGNSNNFIVDHNNENVDSYEWFTLSENGTYTKLDTFANERIIDCNLAKCDTTKILGVKITSGNCHNLIFDEDELFTNVKEQLNNSIFNISPTINKGEFYINLISKNPQKKYHLSVYNIAGQSVYDAKLKQSATNFISIAKASPGVYLAVIKEGQQPIAQQKLMIY